MKCCQLSVYLPLAMMAILSQPIALVADEPLSMKIELRYGPKGPVRTTNIVSPGDVLCFAAHIQGLKADDQGVYKIKYQAELRKDNNEVLSIVAKRELEFEHAFAKGRVTIPCDASIQKDYFVGSKLRFVITVKDQLGGTEIKEEFPFEIRETTGAYLIHVAFAQGNADQPSSGRFTVGEKVNVGFRVMGLEETKQVQCKLMIIPKGDVSPTKELEFSKATPDVPNLDKGRPHFFFFDAVAPFEGIVRLSVTDDAGNLDTVELPFIVSDALGAEPQMIAKNPAKPTSKLTKNSTYVAERPGDGSKPTKKE